jgi:hypothetical protein
MPHAKSGGRWLHQGLATADEPSAIDEGNLSRQVEEVHWRTFLR